jgi:MFS family permease
MTPNEKTVVGYKLMFAGTVVFFAGSIIGGFTAKAFWGIETWIPFWVCVCGMAIGTIIGLCGRVVLEAARQDRRA